MVKKLSQPLPFLNQIEDEKHQQNMKQCDRMTGKVQCSKSLAGPNGDPNDSANGR